jgi:hypothetical protein
MQADEQRTSEEGKFRKPKERRVKTNGECNVYLFAAAKKRAATLFCFYFILFPTFFIAFLGVS